MFLPSGRSFIASHIRAERREKAVAPRCWPHHSRNRARSSSRQLRALGNATLAATAKIIFVQFGSSRSAPKSSPARAPPKRKNFLLDLRLNRIREFHSRSTKSASRHYRDKDCAKPKSPRPPQIPRSRTSHATPGVVSTPARHMPRPSGRKPSRNTFLNMRPRFARIASDQNAIPRIAHSDHPAQIMSQRCAHAHQCRVIERKLARDTSDSIRAKQLLAHGVHFRGKRAMNFESSTAPRGLISPPALCSRIRNAAPRGIRPNARTMLW